MAVGDIKKPHVDVDRREYSPGTMRTRAVLPGEILVDGNGNPLGGSIVVISTDADAALAAVEALAADMDAKIGQAAQDAFDGAVELMEALEEQDEFDDAAAMQAARDALQAAVADLEGQIADVYVGIDALAAYVDAEDAVLDAKIDATATEARLETTALVESAVLALETQIADGDDTAMAALATETERLDQKIDATAAEARVEAVALADSAQAQLEAELADVSSAAAASLATEVDRLDAKVDAGDAESRREAAAGAGSVADELSYEIGESISALEAYVDTEVKGLNDRIGAKSRVLTVDAAPTLLATVTPPARTAARIYAKIVGLRDNHYEAAIYSILTMARAVPSEETLTLTANVANGDQVQIDGLTYTFETVLTPGGTNNVLIGGTAGATLDDLIKAIDDSGVPDTDYGAGTVRHPTFTAARGAGTTLIAIARLPGTAANGSSVTDPVDAGGVMSWGAAVTSGGTDMSLFNGGAPVTTEYEDVPGWAAAVAAVGANVEISVTGEVGKNIWWQCEVEVVENPTWV